MKRFIKRLWLALTYGPELEEVLIIRRREAEGKRREDDQHRLHLCYRHRQERNHSHYAEHNCDHCKVLAKLGEKTS